MFENMDTLCPHFNASFMSNVLIHIYIGTNKVWGFLKLHQKNFLVILSNIPFQYIFQNSDNLGY